MNQFPTFFVRKMVLALALVVAVAGVGVGVFFFMKYQKAQHIITTPGLAGQLEAQDLVRTLSRLIVLPEGETPAAATVSDYEKLKDQPFFAHSQNGDKVLIYTQAKKAYLYRPSTDHLIDVTILNLDAGLNAQAAAALPDVQDVRIVLRNGTVEAGLTNQFEPDIQKVLPGSTIVIKENAARDDYTTTTVVVLTERATQAATTLANYLKGTVASLPAGESKPSDADILVIIGGHK